VAMAVLGMRRPPPPSRACPSGRAAGARSSVAVVAAMVLWSRFVTLRRRERLLSGDLDRARDEARRWKTEASDVLRGLGAAIDAQFGRWGLSSAEREVALLLLKGLAHKEIAEVRQTSEKTVRQQSLAVYRKAGLSGRAELSAFFPRRSAATRGRSRHTERGAGERLARPCSNRAARSSVRRATA
jgi:DNA-binding CsgD family transcriptional regulator